MTKIAFGGERLQTACATTARKAFDEAALRDRPLAGHVLAFEPGVAGLPARVVAI